MSPNVSLEFDANDMLVATNENGTKFKWSYSDFENFLNENITPSMYEFMAGFVFENISKDALWELEAEDYAPGHLEETAVTAYFDIPALERQEMHVQMLENLNAELKVTEEKEAASMNWLIDDEKHPFDITSPIYVEMCNFVRSLVEKYKKKRDDLENQIHEEEQWRGGWEEGASQCGDAPMYDPEGEI